MGLPLRVSAIVFDCDGLLLDTETCWSRAEAALFADHGFPFGPREKDLLIGRSVPAACENMARYFGRPGDGASLEADLIPRVEAELARDVEPMPGARALHRCGDSSGRIPDHRAITAGQAAERGLCHDVARGSGDHGMGDTCGSEMTLSTSKI